MRAQRYGKGILVFLLVTSTSYVVSGCGRWQGNKKKGSKAPQLVQTGPDAKNIGENGQDAEDVPAKAAEVESRMKISMPAKGMEMAALKDGEYAVAQIASYFTGTVENVAISGGFSHKTSLPFELNAIDETDHASDWGKMDREERSYKIAQEINLPLVLKVEGGSASFLDRRHYKTEISSLGAWCWSSTADNNLQGSRFHKLFSEGTVQNGIYKNPQVKMYSDEIGSFGMLEIDSLGVHFYFEVMHEKQTRIVRITYQKV